MNHTQITNKLNAAVGYPPPKVTRMEEIRFPMIQISGATMDDMDPSNDSSGGYITNWLDIEDLAENN